MASDKDPIKIQDFNLTPSFFLTDALPTELHKGIFLSLGHFFFNIWRHLQNFNF